MHVTEEISLLARLHAEELDDKLLNMYLQAKYKSDISNIRMAPPAIIDTKRLRSSGGCPTCPHVYGEPVNGYHEVALPGDSLYSGEMVGGCFNGLGILTLKDGTKLQGEFRNSQLVRPFSVDNMRVSNRSQEMEKSEQPIVDSEFQPSRSESAPEHEVGAQRFDAKGTSEAAQPLRSACADSNSAEAERQQRRFEHLHALLSKFAQLQSLKDADKIEDLAQTHCKDTDDVAINAYLAQTYQKDLSALDQPVVPAESRRSAPPAKKAKSQTYTCRLCPHHYGQLLSGHHEIHLPDGSRYVGDMTNGVLQGLGILTRTDGSKLQGQFEGNQLVMPFSVEDIRSTVPHGMHESAAAEDRKIEVPSANKMSVEQIANTNGAGPDLAVTLNSTACREARPSQGLIEHPVFELASDTQPPAQAFFTNGLSAVRDERTNIPQRAGPFQQTSASVSKGSPGPLLQQGAGLRQGSQLSSSAYNAHMSSVVHGGGVASSIGLGGSAGPQYSSVPGAVHMVDAVHGGTPGPQRNPPEPASSGEQVSYGLLNGTADTIVGNSSTSGAVAFSYYSEPVFVGTPGPVANPYRMSVPQPVHGSAEVQYEQFRRLESPSHVPSCGTPQQHDMLHLYNGVAFGPAVGYPDSNQGIFLYQGGGSSNGGTPSQPLTHDQVMSDQRYMQEPTPYGDVGQYFRPPLLESHSRQNMMSVGFATSSGQVLNEKRRMGFSDSQAPSIQLGSAINVRGFSHHMAAQAQISPNASFYSPGVATVLRR